MDSNCQIPNSHCEDYHEAHSEFQISKSYPNSISPRSSKNNAERQPVTVRGRAEVPEFRFVLEVLSGRLSDDLQHHAALRLARTRPAQGEPGVRALGEDVPEHLPAVRVLLPENGEPTVELRQIDLQQALHVRSVQVSDFEFLLSVFLDCFAFVEFRAWIVHRNQGLDQATGQLYGERGSFNETP